MYQPNNLTGNTRLRDYSSELPDIISKRPNTSKTSEKLNKVGLVHKSLNGTIPKRASTASAESSRNH